jgi:hypothetical protein
MTELAQATAAFLSWLDRQHEALAATSPGVCGCGSLLAPDGTCGVRPSTHEAMLDW